MHLTSQRPLTAKSAEMILVAFFGYDRDDAKNMMSEAETLQGNWTTGDVQVIQFKFGAGSQYHIRLSTDAINPVTEGITL